MNGMRIFPGLVSITFRKLTVREIAERAAACGLRGIEWGGDIHVPHGDLERAREVRAMSVDLGLSVAAYGSYYRAGDAGELEFATVCETAHALGAPTIRVWAGRRGSAEADEAYRTLVIEDLLRAGELAMEARMTLSLESHNHTLTDTVDSTEDLLRRLPPEVVQTYWQPQTGVSVEEGEAGLRRLVPRLSNLHVFQWTGDPVERRPLAEGFDVWKRYLRAVSGRDEPRWAMLEFVRDDNPDCLAAEAATLRELLAEAAACVSPIDPPVSTS